MGEHRAEHVVASRLTLRNVLQSPEASLPLPLTEEETRAQVKAPQSHSSSVGGPESKPQSLIPESVLFTRLW